MADENGSTGSSNKATIVELDDIVPRSIIFRLHNEDWIIPGDIDVETTFVLQQLLLEMAEAEEDARVAGVEALDLDHLDREAAHAGAQRQREAIAEASRVTLRMEAEILKLFQVHHPQLDKLPFGAAGFQAVLMHILTVLGFGIEEDEPKDPPTMTPPRTRKSAKSKPSTTSTA